MAFSYLPPWLTRFPVAKMSKAQLDRDINMDTIMEISVVYDHLFFMQQHSCPLP